MAVVRQIVVLAAVLLPTLQHIAVIAAVEPEPVFLAVRILQLLPAGQHMAVVRQIVVLAAILLPSGQHIAVIAAVEPEPVFLAVRILQLLPAGQHMAVVRQIVVLVAVLLPAGQHVAVVAAVEAEPVFLAVRLLQLLPSGDHIAFFIDVIPFAAILQPSARRIAAIGISVPPAAGILPPLATGKGCFLSNLHGLAVYAQDLFFVQGLLLGGLFLTGLFHFDWLFQFNRLFHFDRLLLSGCFLGRLLFDGLLLRGCFLGGLLLDGCFLGGLLLGGRFLGGLLLGGNFLGGCFLNGLLLGGNFLSGRFLYGLLLRGCFLGRCLESSLADDEINVVLIEQVGSLDGEVAQIGGPLFFGEGLDGGLVDVTFHDRFVLGEGDMADHVIHLLHNQHDAVRGEHTQGLCLQGVRIHRHIAIGSNGIEHRGGDSRLNRGLLALRNHKVSQARHIDGFLDVDFLIQQFSIYVDFIARERRFLHNRGDFLLALRYNRRQIILCMHDNHRHEHRDGHQ